MTLKLVTAPAVEPLSLQEVQTHLRLDSAINAEDALLGALITAARQQAEYETGRALITQTWEQVLDAFPVAEIELGMPPVASIPSLKYLDIAGAEQTLDPAKYTLDADTLPGWVLPVHGATWPKTIDSANAVRVRFTCGYGAAGTAVPAAIRQWMLLQIGAMYRNRESFVDRGSQPAVLPGNFVAHLLDPFRVYL